MCQIFILLSLFASLICGSPIEYNVSPDNFVPADDAADYRLNSDVLPSHYDIQLTPYFENEDAEKQFTFHGLVTITVEATVPDVTNIILHMNLIEILSWSITNKEGELDIGIQQYNATTDKLTLPLKNSLEVGSPYFINFEYIGVLGEDMHGFYRTYFNENGKKVWMASTQFQQYDARRAFPCFDEPKFKATFSLKIIHLATQRAFSNMPIKVQSTLANEKIQDEFLKTPKMSTYLLAFIVAAYDTNEKGNFGVLARPQARNQTDYSLDVGIKLLKALEDWVDFKYTDVDEVERMYMAAVPDFSAGAMENWGLLTYRETNILYVKTDSTSMQQQRIANVISHEIAHQWFGDLVTCEWWDVTWLNEGFARYFQFFGTLLVEENWELEHQFVVEQLQGVFQLDALETTHAMTSETNTKSDIKGKFDNISYNKGAVILRMLEHYMTSELFKAAVRDYIKERKLQTARPEDLFKQVEAQSDENAVKFITPWTTAPGYPLVSVSTETDGYKLSQKRFLINKKEHTDPLLWPIPVTYATKETDFAILKRTEIFQTKEHKITLNTTNDYFILNNQQVGYYRVNYDAENWKKISDSLRLENYGGIHVLNRAQIVDDLYNLARGDVVEYQTALEILDYIKGETEYIPWLSTFNGLSFLATRVPVQDEKLFGNHIMDILSETYNAVKFEVPAADERRVTTYHRINVLTWACKYRHTGCIEKAIAEFEKMLTTPEYEVHPDLRPIVYCVGAREGGLEHFNFLWSRYLTHNVATELITILQGMGCTRAGVTKYMDAILGDDIRPQDKNNAFTYIYTGNNENVDIAFDYIAANHTEWSNVFGGYSGVASSMNSLASRFKTDEQAEKLREFAETNKEIIGDEAYNSIQKGLEDYAVNKLFADKNSPQWATFFKTKSSATTNIISATLTIFAVAFSLIFNF